MLKSKILLIEDDPNLGYILQEALELQEFEVLRCEDGEAGYAAYLANKFDLALVDVMLPKKDGFTLARDIRKIDQELPLIFLTAKSLKDDRIEGFKSGADDYLSKPFSMEELVLRIQAVLKRCKKNFRPESVPKIFQVGHYQFDYEQHLLTGYAQTQSLTDKEAELLYLLCRHKNEVLDRELALNQIWGEHTIFTARSMDVYISKLRKFLNLDPALKIINVHGKGYRLIEKK